jgi:2-hydroxycyclohexanecarboxyl-CoA dehydrogenase
VGVQEAAAEVTALGRRALGIKADVTSSTEVKRMFEQALAEFGRIDILVNNAGGAVAIGPFVSQNEADWDRDINLNLKSFMLLTKLALPGMLERQYGKIINISSGTAKMGAPTFEAYAACKAGIGGLTKSLAQEVATSGINVNCVAPGAANTGFPGGPRKRPVSGDKDQHNELVESRVPQKRATTPQDIANMVAFLASDVASNITGQMYSVDGGLTMTS